MVAFGGMRRRRPHRGTRSQKPADVPVYGPIGKGPRWDTEEEAEGAGVRSRGLDSLVMGPWPMRPEKTERELRTYMLLDFLLGPLILGGPDLFLPGM